MTNDLRVFLAGCAIGVLLAVAPSCSGNQKCGPANCEGCCDADGQCVGGAETAACGEGGAECSTCSSAQRCNAGQCEATGTDAGTDAGTEDAGTDAGSMSPPFATHAEFDTARTDAFCAMAVRCGMFATVDGCKASTYVAIDVPLLDGSGAEAALKDGRVTFDGAAARRCVERMDTLACGLFETALTGSDCEGAVKGAVAPGGQCFSSLECGASDFCTTAMGIECPGTCTTRKALGEMASSAAECQAGFYVDADGLCAELVAVGESCAGSGAFGPPKQCVAGAWCDENKICAAKSGQGTACTTDQSCLAPYACRGGKCDPYGALGAACSVFPVEPCKRDLQCESTGVDVPGTCAEKKTSGGCYDPSQCAAGYFCRGMPGMCSAPNALGEACQEFVEGECAADQYCDSVTKLCTQKKAVGQACTDQSSCLGFAFCDGMTCQSAICQDPTP